MAALLLIYFLAAQTPPLQAAPISVRTVKTSAGWQLQVNGQPYYIRGIACNDALGDKGEDLLALVAQTGANTVRIYGDVTDDYLNSAQKQGLKVNVGFWFNAIRQGSQESYLNATHRQELKQKALDYVRRYKNHPAVLYWTMGNEVFSFTDNEAEKEAYGHFLEDLVLAIHKEDPNHPVLYASSYTRCLTDLKKWVPDIDLIGVNVTGGAGAATHWGEKNGFDKPVVVSEYGPLGSWEQRKDVNAAPYDPFDQFKAENYVSSWRQIQSNPQSCIGGFAFVMGRLRNQDSLTWYNMNYGSLRRGGYWAIYELYQGKKPTNVPPKITHMSVSPMSQVKAGSRVQVQVLATDVNGDPLTYDYYVTNIAKDPLIVEKPIFYEAKPEVSRPGEAKVLVPTDPGLYRIYAFVYDGHENVAIADQSVQVVP
jgi:hypothetical protein